MAEVNNLLEKITDSIATMIVRLMAEYFYFFENL